MIPSDAGRQFPGAPGERIAPVTYLFGAKPAETVEPVSEDHAPAAISATHPVFRDESPAPTVRDEPSHPTGDRGNFDRVSNVSMHALGRRGMSSREMRDYLVGREFDDEAVQEEIERLEGVGLLDDDSLAETLVRTLRDRKGLGRSALAAELRRRHVDGDAIEEAMGSLEDDELERATAIAVKRAPQLRSLDSVTAKRRLGAFLMRKGYSGSVISTAVQRALAPSGPAFR
ncbi:MAG: regulatory protein RecX [Rhodoglobus sp.]|nr:regulatory protein RecX [Rhodoglobus sp.]